MPDNRESLYPKDWIEKAKKDLRRAKLLLADGDTEGAGFHLQQAIEKYLKGYLLSKGWRLNMFTVWLSFSTMLKIMIQALKNFELFVSR